MKFSSNDAHKKVDRSSSTEAAGTGNCLGHPSLLLCRASFNKQKICRKYAVQEEWAKHHSDTTKTSATEILPFFFCSVMPGEPFLLLQRGSPVRTKESTTARRFYETLHHVRRGVGKARLLLEERGSRNGEAAPLRAILTTLGDGVSQAHSHRHARCSSSSQIALSFFVSLLNLQKTHQHTVRQRASDAPLRRQHNTRTKKKRC